MSLVFVDCDGGTNYLNVNYDNCHYSHLTYTCISSTIGVVIIRGRGYNFGWFLNCYQCSLLISFRGFQSLQIHWAVHEDREHSVLAVLTLAILHRLPLATAVVMSNTSNGGFHFCFCGRILLNHQMRKKYHMKFRIYVIISIIFVFAFYRLFS